MVLGTTLPLGHVDQTGATLGTWPRSVIPSGSTIIFYLMGGFASALLS